MKYTILIYGNRESWRAMNADSFQALMAAHAAIQEELRAGGEFVDANALPIDNAKIVRRNGGESEVSDGPFVELKEILAGYYVVDCQDMDRAIEVADKLAEAEFGLVEVRQMSSQPRQ